MELMVWLEKRGFSPKFYNDETRDIVDATIKNFQNFNRRLYTNESGIGDEITRRIEALKSMSEMEDLYGLGSHSDDELDRYDNDGYEKLLEEEEFEADIDSGGGE